MTYPQYETPPLHWDCQECGWMIRCEGMVDNDNYQQRENTRSTPHLKVQPTNPPTNTQNAQ
ncbi:MULTISPECIES: hypothetical protein [unclassified Microcoleus]|uniref:hypothetical protein n=1 Tax=unclassified Microcoleus TaxID=2642155 RepID=UPI002FD6BC85